MADGIDRGMMRDLPAEMGVLASVLLDNTTLTVVRGVLSAEDFSAPRHAVIFETFIALAEKGSPIDVLTVTAALRDAERLNAVGGSQYIGELTDALPTTSHCEAHARIVADLAQRRRTVDAAAKIVAYAHEHGGDELAGFAMKVLRDAAPRISQKVKTAEQVADALSERLERLISTRGTPEAESVALPTGLPTLDETLSLGNGRLYVVAARPAMGKSAFAGQIAHHVASSGRGRVIFFAEEMPALEVAHRDVAGRAGVDVRRAERGEIDQGDVDRYVAELNTFNGRAVIYDDTPSVTIEHIEALCQRYAAQGPVALVVVDYLQLLAMPKAERHNLAVGEVTKRLKSLSKSLGCPVICVSQLNRDCESRPDKRPQLADLRDSGSVEQDADGVVFIYRDEVYKRDSKDKGFAEILIAKQRNGPTGLVRLRWRPELVRFEDPANDDSPYTVGGFVARGA